MSCAYGPMKVNSSNAFLGAILLSLKRGVVVVDRNYIIMMWNRMAEELWGLRFDEAKGQSLLNLDIGLPVRQLRRPIEACMNNDAENRRWLWTPSIAAAAASNAVYLSARGELRGAIIMMDEMGM
jgi:two-component system, chemotaxis family, CheB/CheR fusion protein